MRPLVRNVILSCVLMMVLSAHAALNTIVNPTLSTSVVDASVQTVSYTYNYLGQRVSKTVTQNTLPPTSVTTYYEYNDQGNLLGEYNATGNPLRQYVYLNGERVAMFDYSSGSKQTVYLANNHVGQMQYAWNSSGVLVDTRVQAPFGETASETPVGGLQVPVRFPGQVADSETGYSQNWNRDYDPSTGRYLESDPIGLNGGINTYGYVGQNPIMYVDFMGLKISTPYSPNVFKGDDGKYHGEDPEKGICLTDDDPYLDAMNQQARDNSYYGEQFDQLINSPYDNAYHPAEEGATQSRTDDKDDDPSTPSCTDMYLKNLSDAGHEAGHANAQNNGTHSDGSDPVHGLDTHNQILTKEIQGGWRTGMVH